MPVKSQLLHFAHRDCKVPVKVVVEYRRNTRYSLGKKNFIFRIPRQLSSSQRAETVDRGVSWAKNLLVEKPDVVQRFKPTTYSHGDLINCYDRSWKLSFLGESKRSMVKVETDNGANTLILSQHLESGSEDSVEKVSKLIRAALSGFYRDIVFQKSAKTAEKFNLPRPTDCRLKYMSSRWGSCQTKGGKLSINTRLLLAPEEILDAVVIHELCHFIYPNHSRDFWNLVVSCCPDYSERNQWLKTNGDQLRL